MDMGTVLDGSQAVKEGLMDEIGSVGKVLQYLYKEIEKEGAGREEKAGESRR